MLAITYNPYSSKAYPDSKIEELVEEHIESFRKTGAVADTVSNELYINYLRLAIKNGKISNDDVVLYFMKGNIKREIHFDPDGRTSDEFPPSYFDDALMQLI